MTTRNTWPGGRLRRLHRRDRTEGIGALVVPQPAVANLSTVAATTALNVRLQPNTNAQILGVLSAGEQVDRGDPQGDA